MNAGGRRVANPTGTATATATVTITNAATGSGTGSVAGATTVAATAFVDPGTGGTLGFGNTLVAGPDRTPCPPPAARAQRTAGRGRGLESIFWDIPGRRPPAALAVSGGLATANRGEDTHPPCGFIPGVGRSGSGVGAGRQATPTAAPSALKLFDPIRKTGA